MRSSNTKWKRVNDREIKILVLVYIMLVSLFMNSNIVFANEAASYVNQETGYQACVADDANLLSEEQAAMLVEQMQGITVYGNVMFASSSDVVDSTKEQAKQIYKATFGETCGTVFYIDMYNRIIYIYSQNAVYDVITTSYANTITDNVYRYATAGDYYTCASKAYEQELRLLQGQRVPQPMKYASNILIAFIAAAIIIYLFIRDKAVKGKATDDELMIGMEVQQRPMHIKFNLDRTKQVYSPQSSGSSGGGSHGGGGFGGGGGSHGGGGGHGF